MNQGVIEHGHHPNTREYTPAAFRHYVRRLALLEAMAGLDFKTALDVGCAEGFFMDAIRERFGTEIWGVDISDAAVIKCREQLGAPVAAGDALSLPFADGSFDLVYSTETIEHVLHPDQMIAEMKRVARRWVVVTTPVSQSEHEHEPDFELKDEGHVNDFDRSAMVRLFGPDAHLGSFRSNATFALVKGFGRHLPAGLRDAFYGLDHWTAKRFGDPHKSFTPLRNRDWLIVAPGGGHEHAEAPEWRCPDCRGELEEANGEIRCVAEGRAFRLLAPGVPDFASPTVPADA
jgi:ubiquinone/menaquinone biosynthesis C-methylase UbiE